MGAGHFALLVSPENLKQRLSTHEHDSHHLPGEVERILTNHKQKQQAFVDDGCTPVDANRPASEIARDILELARIDRPISNSL